MGKFGNPSASGAEDRQFKSGYSDLLEICVFRGVSIMGIGLVWVQDICRFEPYHPDLFDGEVLLVEKVC